MPTLQYNELLAKREVFQNEATMAAEDVNQRSEPEKQQVEHGPDLYQIMLWSIAVSC